MLNRRLNWTSKIRHEVTNIIEAANELDEVLREYDVLDYANVLQTADFAATAHEGLTKQQVVDAVASLRLLRTWLNGANGTNLYKVKD